MVSAQDALNGLREAIASPLTRNDLGRLAQMHSWGQALAEHAVSGGGDEGLLELAVTTVAMLERIILDEAADLDAALALLPRAVNALQAACENGALDAEAVNLMKAAAGGNISIPAPSPKPAAKAPPATKPVEPPPAPAAPAAPIPQPPAAAGASDDTYVSEPLIIDLDETEHLQGFLDEAQEHMDAIEAGLLAVESNPSDTHQLNELFRPFHTIKGIAGFLNLRDINRLTHEIETILDQGRKNELRITAGIVDLIFKAVDSLKAQLDAIRGYMAAPTAGPCPQPVITEMMGKLRLAATGAFQSDETEPSAGPQSVTDAGGDTGAAGAASAAGRAAQGDHSIRVDTAKLDTLVDAVGELVIAQSMVSLSKTVLSDDKLARVVSQVTKIVRDVQETAMAMRMVPIGQTFQKMRRLVRDVARKAGKQVELVINGEETELDKNVIQQISDPLVHMVRNAVDHGVEPADLRKAIGKPETGTVTLNAYHQGDSIVIEIRDDGRGLDRDKLIAKGIERGVVTEGETLSDAEAFALIFAPGFSTAEVVTDISGRGVGMDVVRRNVEQLRGKIEIQSEKGRGSAFLIKLPLTLAIIDGMLVRVGTERLIIPTILIEQSVRPERKQITSVQQRGQMVQIRGELCPLIQLGALFGYVPPVDPCENQVVIVQCENQKIALVVEELIGQQQVVIKSLGERFKVVRGISGAAILGDGKVGLILEPSGILTLHKTRGSVVYEQPTHPSPAGSPGPAADAAFAALETEEAAGAVAVAAAADTF